MRYLILNSDIIFKIMFPDTGYRIKLLYCGTTLFKILPQRGGKCPEKKIGWKNGVFYAV